MITLEQYLKEQGVNDYTDQETVRKLTNRFMLSNAQW